MNATYFMPKRTQTELRLLIKVGTVTFLFPICSVALLLLAGETLPGGLTFPSVLLGIGFPSLAFLSYFVRPSRVRRPTVIIDESGVTDCLSTNCIVPGTPATLGWEEIKSVTPRSWYGFRFLALRPHDTKAFIERQKSRPLRFGLWTNHYLTGSAVGIWQYLCPEPLPQLESLIENRIALRDAEASVADANAARPIAVTEAAPAANLLQARR